MVRVIFIYYFVISILFIAGVRLLINSRKTKGREYIKFRRSLVRSARKSVIAQLDNPEVSRVLFESGVSCSGFQYNGFRVIAVISLIIIQFKSTFVEQAPEGHIFLYVAGIILLSTPREQLLGVRMPFGYMLEIMQKRRKEKIDRELFSLMTQLKNLCIAQGDCPLSGDYLIEHMHRFSSCTRQALSKLLTLWRLGQIEEGCSAFAGILNTKLSIEFSSILLKLESMNPIELSSHIELFQSHIREEHMTRHMRRQEVISYVLYTPVIASAFLIMLNFMVIAIWMDTVNLIQKL